jgi:hypothetical protein
MSCSSLIIFKQNACSGVHTGLAVGKIPSQYSKKSFETCICPSLHDHKHSEDGTIKIHTKPIEFSDIISKNTEKCKRMRNEI